MEVLLTIVAIIFIILMIVTFFKTVRVVPPRTAFVVESLGKYSRTIEAGFYILIPFIEKVAYKRSLKEEAIDVPQQTCITKDNVSVAVDGVLFLQVVDAKKSAYGIEDYKFSTIQLAQTTMRSVFGMFILDETFEAREIINSKVVQALDEASEPWGVKVTRYEIKDIVPPHNITEAMEKQMKAERDKRAIILESEGEKQSQINKADGLRQAMIFQSEGEKQKKINEAEGKASEIEKIANATAQGIERIASAINQPGGKEAVTLRIAEQYIYEFGKLAKTNNTMIIPTTMSDISSIIATATKVMETIQHPNAPKKAITE